jgi:hypothetical protein
MKKEYHKRKHVPRGRSDEDFYKLIQKAIQDLAREGLIIDSGERKWSERTGRYEIVWMAAPTRH